MKKLFDGSWKQDIRLLIYREGSLHNRSYTGKVLGVFRRADSVHSYRNVRRKRDMIRVSHDNRLE